MKKIKLLVGSSIITGLVAVAVPALAAEPFLCPVVGDGVQVADSRNGENGVSVINPPVGTSFLPGNNQAGANSNPQAHNSDGPDNPNSGPGQNSDFSPIWPAS